MFSSPIHFVNDMAFVIGAGPANIPCLAMGHFIGLFCFRVVDVQVQGVVAIRSEIDFVADPHGVAMAARIVSNFFRRVSEFSNRRCKAAGPILASSASRCENRERAANRRLSSRQEQNRPRRISASAEAAPIHLQPGRCRAGSRRGRNDRARSGRRRTCRPESSRRPGCGSPSAAGAARARDNR